MKRYQSNVRFAALLALVSRSSRLKVFAAIVLALVLIRLYPADDGRVETVYLWFATNLPPELFSPRQLATIYRFRWEVEQLFRTLKMVGRLDHLRSANPHVIHAFIYATLLGMVLSHDICALMRRKKPGCEPSPYRVTSLLLMYLPSIIAVLGTRKLRPTLKALERALWREGVNPNPGRPYRSTIYAEEIRCVA